MLKTPARHSFSKSLISNFVGKFELELKEENVRATPYRIAQALIRATIAYIKRLSKTITAATRMMTL